MGQSLAIPRVIKDDWKRLDLIINKIKMKLGRDSSPTVAGLTITGLTASALIGANASKALESVTIGTGLDYTRPTLSLSHLGLEALTDPGADRIFFWDDSASASKWLSVGPSVAITATNLDTIQDIQTSASPTFANLSLGTGELTAGSINRAAGTLTLEIAGTAEISISSTTVTLGGNLVIPDAGYIGSASDANAIQIAASGEVSFTDVATGILPTAGAHLATKEYVDLAIGASADFFLSDNDDAVIADYHILYETDTGEVSSTLVTDPMVENDDQLMFSYITASGVPGVEFLRAGVYILHTHMSRGTGDKPTTFYWTLSKYTIGDVETVILTSEESSAIPDSTISFITHATLAADTAILVTDRLVLKIYANVGAAGGNSEVTIHMEGIHDCHLTNQLPSSIWQNQGDVLDDLNTLGIVGADGEFLVGTGAGALAWEGGATARASLGLTIGTDVQAYHANLAAIAGGTWTGAASITTLGTIATVGNITIANNGTIGQAAGPLLTFDDTNNFLEITGCNVGIGLSNPTVLLHLLKTAYYCSTVNDVYSDETSQCATWTSNKSHSDSIANVATINGEHCGQWGFLGNSGSGFEPGIYMDAYQNGAVGTNVPLDFRFQIYKADGTYTRHYFRANGSVEFGDNVGVKTAGPVSLLHITQEVDSADDATLDNFGLIITNPVNDDEEVGIGFRLSATITNAVIPGGAITFERTGAGSIGSLHFKTSPDGTLLTTRVTIDKTGGVFCYNLKSGTDQANAGAAADELYHDTDDNTIKIGV